MGVAETMAIGGAAASIGSIGAQIYSGIKGANAQEQAAKEAAAAQAAGQQQTREALMAAAAPSPQEIMLQERQLEIANRAIARQEKILAAVDPAIMESGKQALALLRGQESAATQPFAQERARQREALRASLRQQLGSGFENSSAGIEALTRFDQETASGKMAVQQQTLGQLLGASMGAAQPGISGASFAGSESLAQGLQAYQAQRGARMQSILGAPITPQGGLGQIGNIGTYQALSQGFGGLGSIGGLMLGAGMFQAGKTPASAPAPTPASSPATPVADYASPAQNMYAMNTMDSLQLPRL